MYMPKMLHGTNHNSSNSSPNKSGLVYIAILYLSFFTFTIIHITSLIILRSNLFDQEFLCIVIKEAGPKRNEPK